MVMVVGLVSAVVAEPPAPPRIGRFAPRGSGRSFGDRQQPAQSHELYAAAVKVKIQVTNGPLR